MDKLVIDIETKNSFEDVGGREGLKNLDISVVGVYSYQADQYLSFDENELPALGALLQKSHLIITFAGLRFDIPILAKYFSWNLNAIKHFDILEEVESRLGRRIGLGILAEANLGVGKTGNGLEAIELYRNGEIEKLKSYCLNDVKITKDLYELIKNQGYLWIPERYTSQMTKLILPYKEEEPPQNQLF